MPVQFIIGRAGSGKSRGCFEQIVEMMRAQPLGPPIFLIVPKQETFSAERVLTCGSGLKGFCRTYVLSFEAMAELILAQTGGAAIPAVTGLGRQMMLGHLLRKHEGELQHYNSTARRIGLAAALDGAFAELERCGRGAIDLENVLSSLKHDADDPSLVRKLSDLRLLYGKYLTYLGSERLDPHRRLEQVLSAMDRCASLRGATVFVDGFLEFADWQRKLLVGLGRLSRDVTITMLMDPKSRVLKDPHHIPDELELFHRTELTYRQMWFAFSEAGLAPEPVKKLEHVERFENPSLKQIEERLFASRRVVCRQVENIELIEAPDRRAEVDAAARQVQKWVGMGLRYRDIAVLARDVEGYHELIDASFREHGIPSFTDRRRTAAHHPLLQFTRASLQLATSDWPRDAVMALLKSELAGFERDAVDELENYILEHRIAGGSAWMDPNPWTFKGRKGRAGEDEPSLDESSRLSRVDAMRLVVSNRLEDLVGFLGGIEPLKMRDIAKAVVDTLERFSVRQTISKWMKDAEENGRLEEREEHQQVWNELTELFDQMVDVIGDEKVMPDDFVHIVETGLEQFDLALTPPTIDQVLVGAVDRTRNVTARGVVLLGMNDNQFPRVGSEDSILADSERDALKKLNLELDPPSGQNLLDERLLGYIALTRSSDRLCLIRSIADSENRPQSPSPFWAAVRGQFPSLQPIHIPRQSGSADTIGTPRQLIARVMHWVRESEPAPGPWAGLYHWLATSSGQNESLRSMLRQSWGALTYSNQPALSPAIIERLFTSPLRCSVSQIESFAACGFKHFVEYGLRLAPRDEEDVTAQELGQACHSILERMCRQMFVGQEDWETHSLAEQEAMIERLAEEVGKELRGELLVTGGRNQYILSHVRKTLSRVMDGQSAAGKRGRFVPWQMELGFGEKTKLGALVLQTPRGHALHLKGKIDRVDKVRDEAAFAVIDYKLNGDRLALDQVLHGLSLQLLTYLLVLQENGSKLLKRQLTPVAALYVQLLRKIETVEHPGEAQEPVGLTGYERCRPRGIIDASQAGHFDNELEVDGKAIGPLFTRTDACTAEQFAAMLNLARRKLAELGDMILSGAIEVAPYRIGTASPCTHCKCRPVCRFDPGINSYRRLPVIKREDVFARAMEGKS